MSSKSSNSSDSVEFIADVKPYLPKKNSIIVDLTTDSHENDVTNNHEDKKRKWSDEETRAVKDGYKKYKSTRTLKWVKIKNDVEFSNTLINRTPVQIKDKVRTLKKRTLRKKKKKYGY